MRSKKHINEAHKNMTIEQLKAIRENQYRSTCCTFDYCPKSIDKMLADKLSKQWQREDEQRINDENAYLEHVLSELNETNKELVKLWQQYKGD